MNRRQLTSSIFIIGLALVFVLGAFRVEADPTGASILSNSTAGTPTSSPASRADARGTITTIVLNTLQQDQFWKAYVGNVSGRLSLDDAAGNTIYDWTLLGAISGEVYVSRYSSPTFTSLSCANDANVTSEQTYFGMSASASDNINNTYNYTNHKEVVVGGFGTIPADTCKSTATYVNDTPQSINGNQTFQSLILQDSSDRLIFVTLIDDDSYSFDNDITVNKTNDFQVIVPESATNSTPTTYYFWTELDG